MWTNPLISAIDKRYLLHQGLPGLVKWLLTLQSWEGCMWEKHRSLLLVSSSKSEEPEGAEPLCRGAGEGTAAAESCWCWWIDESQLNSLREHREEGTSELLQSTGDPLLLCPPGAAFPGCHTWAGLDLSQQTALMWLSRPCCGTGLRQAGRDTCGHAWAAPRAPLSLVEIFLRDIPVFCQGTEAPHIGTVWEGVWKNAAGAVIGVSGALPACWAWLRSVSPLPGAPSVLHCPQSPLAFLCHPVLPAGMGTWPCSQSCLCISCLSAWLFVCPSVWPQRRQGELRLRVGAPAVSFRRAKWSEWPSSRALFCCLFVCSFIKICSSSRNEKIEAVCLCECIVLRGCRHNSHIPHAWERLQGRAQECASGSTLYLGHFTAFSASEVPKVLVMEGHLIRETDFLCRETPFKKNWGCL